MQGLEKVRDHPTIKKLEGAVREYNLTLEQFGLRDHQIAESEKKLTIDEYHHYYHPPNSPDRKISHTAWMLICRLSQLTVLFLCLPALIFNVSACYMDGTSGFKITRTLFAFREIQLPVIIPANLYSQAKAKEAKAKSSVKLSGRDVMATWKLITAFVGELLLLRIAENDHCLND